MKKCSKHADPFVHLFLRAVTSSVEDSKLETYLPAIFCFLVIKTGSLIYSLFDISSPKYSTIKIIHSILLYSVLKSLQKAHCGSYVYIQVIAHVHIGKLMSWHLLTLKSNICVFVVEFPLLVTSSQIWIQPKH